MGEGLVENFCRTFGQVVKGIRSRVATDRLLGSMRLMGGRMVLYSGFETEVTHMERFNKLQRFNKQLFV